MKNGTQKRAACFVEIKHQSTAKIQPQGRKMQDVLKFTGQRENSAENMGTGFNAEDWRSNVTTRDFN